MTSEKGVTVIERLYAYQETLCAQEKIERAKESLARDKQLLQTKHEFSAEKKRFLACKQRVEALQGATVANSQRQAVFLDHIAKNETKLYGGDIAKPRELSAVEAKNKELNTQLTHCREEGEKLQERYDQEMVRLKESGRKLKSLHATFDIRKAELQSEDKRLEAEIQTYANKLQQMKVGIDPQALDNFLKERTHYDGRLYARIIRGDICNCCFRKLPKPMLQRILNGAQNIRCDTCNRILLPEKAE